MGESRRGQQERDDIVADVCEQCIIGAMCQVKWYELWAYRLRSTSRGGGGRPRPFIIIAIWAGFMLAENRGSTVSYKGSSQQWHCYYAFMLGSLSCLPMMSGEGIPFP